jgi:CDP-diacylglycerol--serine O-phosphatidyltransferase
MVSVESDLEWLPYLTLIVPLLSGYRLAKFNIDTRQTDQFIGLPTPANALFISTLPYFALVWPKIGDWLSSPLALVGIAWLMAILLILELPLIALKFKNFSFSQNVFRYVLIIISLGLVIPFGLAGIPIIILAYIGLSIIENSKKRE